MAEMKRNFSKAIMNKDMDERLVPPGQYRDALNIQISTSDGSDVGAVQTLKGNTQHNTMLSESGVYAIPSTATCVGSIAAKDLDKIYYFISAGDNNATNGHTAIRKDYILEYDTVLEKHRYVFVDIYKVTTTTSSTASALNQAYINIDAPTATINDTGIRIGMIVTGTINGVVYVEGDGLEVSNIVFSDIADDDWKVYLKHPDGTAFSSPPTAGDDVVFTAPEVLNFSKDRIITGINILDDFIYWTDNYSEPKKVSISRSVAGTGGTAYLTGAGIAGWEAAATANTHVTFDGDTDTFHTRLVKDKSAYSDEANRYEVVTTADLKKAVYVDESHVTVIKKAPTQPLELDMFRGPSTRVTDAGVENSIYSNCTLDLTDIEVGDTVLSVVFGPQEVDFRVGDILLLAKTDTTSSAQAFEEYHVRAEVVASNVTTPDTLSTTGFELKILSFYNLLGDEPQPISFYVRLETKESLFKYKFPRFSYRYKYQDGEYSTFAPWSQIAFLPDFYEYNPKKGYNLGMVNQIRAIKIKGYHAQETTMPQDVVEIDLLYKETNNPTVYTVKTIRRSDGFDNGIWPDIVSNASARGEFLMDMDMLYAVVPANQLLRPWDNVPRLALGQEISANRLIYANYLHNYTIQEDPVIDVGFDVNSIWYVGHSPTIDRGYALPSVKTMREYQVGVVFSDAYGRETPVLTSKQASVFIPKDFSHRKNRLTAVLNQATNIPDWAKYYSFYVKETSIDYYTMSMDRWYHAEDGNIWLSFPSSERNKLDEETYLSLKKAHGTDVVIGDKQKYKVLAIESEAPDFIKSIKKPLGTLIVNMDNEDVGIGGFYPVVDGQALTIRAGVFHNAFGDDLQIKTPDTLLIRLHGSGSASSYYEVANLASIGVSGGDGYYKLTIVGKFEGDVAFTSSNGAVSGAISDLRIELFEEEVENKPEFDGRFFVKINRDSTIDEHVIGSQIIDTVITNQWKLRHINNNGWRGQFDDTGYGSYASGPWSGNNMIEHTGYAGIGGPSGDGTIEGDVDYRDRHPTQRVGWGIYHWGNGDDVYGLDADTMYGDPIAINREDKGKDFWKGVASEGCFFIDCCTAYSWTGRIGSGTSSESIFTGHRPGEAEATETGLIDGRYNFWGAGAFPGAMAGGNMNGPMGGETSNMGVDPDRGALPSRGIWNSGSYMDISWVGMDAGYTGDSWDPPYPQKLEDCTGATRMAAWEFIKKLVTPNTKFKFKRDPEAIIYTVQDWDDEANYSNVDYFTADTTREDGGWGIRNFRTTGVDRHQYHGANVRQRWTIKVDPPIGLGGNHHYDPIRGTTTTTGDGATYALRHDFSGVLDYIQIVEPFFDEGGGFSENAAIWETEPKESVDLDIYYQASGLIPLELNEETNEEYIPIGSTFKLYSTDTNDTTPVFHTITGWLAPNTLSFTPAIAEDLVPLEDNQVITFTKNNYYSLTARVNGDVPAIGTVSQVTLWGGKNTEVEYRKLYRQKHFLDWSNCWSFDNGLESDRVRDSYNAPQVDNGVKASTVLAGQIKEERRKNGLIWSGIYNSNSGINDTNQFITAEKITKDINPSYGSIQRLLNRDTRLIMFCEDKILRADTNRDLLFNADGSSQVISSTAVVGSAVAYQGDYGISTNPESLAVTPYNVYFTDIIRGQVLALSTEGIRSISNIGMKDYFADISATHVWRSLGTYDERKNEYNVTISKKYERWQAAPHDQTTISYSELSKGWTSFKSFYPQHGASLNNNYYTFFNGHIWKHHVNETRNNFYTVPKTSDITLIFNDAVDAAKSFGAINYEGSQAKITNFDSTSVNYWLTGDADIADGVETVSKTDGEYYNIEATVTGWYVDSVTTNLQTCGNIEFKEKEGKWFGVVSGEDTSLSNLDEKEFSVQGIGTALLTHGTTTHETLTNTVADNVTVGYVGADGSGVAWD